MDNILLGNGINLVNSNLFSTKNILKDIHVSFLFAAETEEFVFWNHYNILRSLYNDKKFRFIIDSSNSVEDFIDKSYHYINEKHFKKSAEINHDLLNVLKRIIINKIYVDCGNLKKCDIPREYKEIISSYKCVFSLNYYEMSYSGYVNYLHGNIDIKLVGLEPFQNDIKSTFSEEWFDREDSIERLNIVNSTFPIRDTDFTILLPSFSNFTKKHAHAFMKNEKKSLLTHGSYKSKEPNLYSSLEKIESLHVFGVSPYGDQDLIDAIKKIKNVVVFIYKIDTNKEKYMWGNLLPHATLLDSLQFLKKTV